MVESGIKLSTSRNMQYEHQNIRRSKINVYKIASSRRKTLTYIYLL